SAEAGLALLEQEHFDLLLMDCLMPGVDGFTATRTRRERERQDGAPRLPVIAITAYAADGIEARCLAAGMDDVLIKPVNLQELDTVLRRWLPDQPGEEDDEASGDDSSQQ